MGTHEQCLGATDEWYTPPYVFAALGVEFDLDVASPPLPHPVAFVPARKAYSFRSLELPWDGFVWMNPPFGGRNGIAPWLDKFFSHGDGLALTPDRTSCPWWQHYAKKADAVLFVAGKIRFLRPDGTEGKSPAQGTTLMAAGPRAVAALNHAEEWLGTVLCP